MSAAALTKSRMKEGLWEGFILHKAEGAPQIGVTYHDRPIEDITLTHDVAADHWVLRVPIPPCAIADGVQTLIIQDIKADAQIGHITLIAGEALADDIRAEMDLLRAELDMLKRAFRRHCLETA